MGALEEIELLLFKIIICGISSISAPSYDEVTASELALLPCTTIKRGGGWHRTTGRTSLRRSERKPMAAPGPQVRDTFLQTAAQQLHPHWEQRPAPLRRQKAGHSAEAPATGCRKRTREVCLGSLTPTPCSQGGYTGALDVLSWEQGRNKW